MDQKQEVFFFYLVEQAGNYLADYSSFDCSCQADCDSCTFFQTVSGEYCQERYEDHDVSSSRIFE
jgi:hypothetical protein